MPQAAMMSSPREARIVAVMPSAFSWSRNRSICAVEHGSSGLPGIDVYKRQWQCWGRRTTLSWIIIALMLLSDLSVYYLANTIVSTMSYR